METVYRQLTQKDLKAFVKMRINQLKEEGATSEINLENLLYQYYSAHIKDGTFVAWLAVEEDKIIATSGISFVEKPPYYENPSGKIGILSSMYTVKEHRRKGLAKQLLTLVTNEAKAYGCGSVQITASEIGVLLYSDFGFTNNRNFMQYTF